MFTDLLNETKGFRYEIIEKVLSKKFKADEEIEFRPVYFNSITKTVTNHKFKLESFFQEILNMIDNWIKKDLARLLNLLSLNTLILQLIDHYQEVLI